MRRLVHRHARWQLKCLVPLAGLALVCNGSAGGTTETNRPAWPPPPAEPRIFYTQSIRSPAELGVKQSVFKRLGKWLSGEGSGSGQLARPFGISLDEAGNLLVTDTGTSEVLCLERKEKKWLRWKEAGKVRFKSPVAVARQGNTVWVADSGLGKVIAFDLKGKPLFELTRNLERPSGLTILSNRLYVADAQRHQVSVWDLHGGYLSSFGQRGGGPGEFNYPTHLAAGPGGRLLVTDSLNGRIQVFDASGRFERSIGSPGDKPGFLGRPKGVGADRFGHIYVVDALFDNVQVYDDQSRLLLNWGETGSDPGEFWLPNGIAVGPDDLIYVADSYNHRIQVFKYNGKL
jgi:DNA-binding beta-propeller fold protein YncE